MRARKLDTAQAKEKVNCKELAEHYLGPPIQRAGRALQWLCPLHQDGATPSFTVYENGYHCFGCDASGDAIDLIRRFDNVGFAEAAEKLNGMRSMGASRQSISQPGVPMSPAKMSKWQEKASIAIEEASKLLALPDGATGRDYLAGRGFEAETWQVWRLGYKQDVQRWERHNDKWVIAEHLGPAITLPWMDRQRPVVLQYRLFGHQKLRYWQQAGGQHTIFGLDQLASRPVLVIIEGEFNAISVWQAAHDLVDVISYGSENNVERAGAYLQALAHRYDCIISWADKAERAVEIAKHVNNVVPFKSPRGLDANDLLQAGRLRGYLQRLLQQAKEGNQSPLVSTRSTQIIEHVSAGTIVSEMDIVPESSDDDVVKLSHAAALEVQLETLLAELGSMPGNGMEFVRSDHPGYETYRRFCELERQWMDATSRSSKS